MVDLALASVLGLGPLSCKLRLIQFVDEVMGAKCDYPVLCTAVIVYSTFGKVSRASGTDLGGLVVPGQPGILPAWFIPWRCRSLLFEPRASQTQLICSQSGHESRPMSLEQSFWATAGILCM